MIIIFTILSIGAVLGVFFRMHILIVAAPAILLFTYLAETSQGSAFSSIATSVLLNETALQFGYIFGAMLRPLVMSSAQIEDGLDV